MADRRNKFLLKRSNVAGKVPTAGDLLLGELALNTADAILYTSGTTTNSILPIGWDRISRTGDTVTGNFVFNGDLTVTGGTITGELNVNVQHWTFDFMDALNITIYADDSFSIDEITNIVAIPTITIEVNDLPYTLGNSISLGDKIYIESDINSVIKIKIVK